MPPSTLFRTLFYHLSSPAALCRPRRQLGRVDDSVREAVLLQGEIWVHLSWYLVKMSVSVLLVFSRNYLSYLVLFYTFLKFLLHDLFVPHFHPFISIPSLPLGLLAQNQVAVWRGHIHRVSGGCILVIWVAFLWLFFVMVMLFVVFSCVCYLLHFVLISYLIFPLSQCWWRPLVQVVLLDLPHWELLLHTMLHRW